jgi:hypothetical protein
MKISKDVYEAHRELSTCSVNFLEFIKDNPESVVRSNFQAIVSDKTYAYFRAQPWPTFINKATKKEMEEAGIKLFDLITSLPERLFDFDPHKMSSCFHIPGNEMELMLYGIDNHHMSGLLGRADFVLSPSDGLKCLEFNMNPSLGGWGIDFLESLYMNTPVSAIFLKEYKVQLCKNHLFQTLMECLIERALERFGRKTWFDGEINIAIGFPKYVEGIMGRLNDRLKDLYKYFLRQNHHALNGDIFICDFEQLQWNRHSLMLRGKRIHVLIEMCYGEIPITFMELVRTGNLLLCNGPITRVMSNKLNLALLSQHQASDRFSVEERETIQKYIPWTRKIVPGETTYKGDKVTLEDFMISNRERLVIKPSRGYGGKGVSLGFNTPPNQWKQEMENALHEKDRVVQEYVPSHWYLYQVGEQGCASREAVWGYFIFSSRYAGGFVRIMPEADNKRVINAGQGAEESIVLEVDE